MSSRLKTVIFIAATIVSIAVFDVYIIIEGGREASISHTLIEWSHEYPSVPFLIGFTMGHLFWRMKSTKIMKDKNID